MAVSWRGMGSSCCYSGNVGQFLRAASLLRADFCEHTSEDVTVIAIAETGGSSAGRGRKRSRSKTSLPNSPDGQRPAQPTQNCGPPSSFPAPGNSPEANANG
jgi:hypothetical protein